MITARQIAPNCVKVEIGNYSAVVDGDLSTMPLEERKQVVRDLIATIIGMEGETDEMQALRESLAE